MQVLSREPVSSWVCTRMEIAFFYSSFLAGKEAKEAGGTYDGSPLTPFQRSTGTLSPSIAPAQGDRPNVSRQAVERTAPRGRRSTAALPKMLVGRVFVSGGILEEGWIIEGTGQGLCFSSGF